MIQLLFFTTAIESNWIIDVGTSLSWCKQALPNAQKEQKWKNHKSAAAPESNKSCPKHLFIHDFATKKGRHTEPKIAIFLLYFIYFLGLFGGYVLMFLSTFQYFLEPFSGSFLGSPNFWTISDYFLPSVSLYYNFENTELVLYCCIFRIFYTVSLQGIKPFFLIVKRWEKVHPTKVTHPTVYSRRKECQAAQNHAWPGLKDVNNSGTKVVGTTRCKECTVAESTWTMSKGGIGTSLGTFPWQDGKNFTTLVYFFG